MDDHMAMASVTNRMMLPASMGTPFQGLGDFWPPPSSLARFFRQGARGLCWAGGGLGEQVFVERVFVEHLFVERVFVVRAFVERVFVVRVFVVRLFVERLFD